MQAAFIIALMGGLFGGSSDTRTVYVYYAAESPSQVGSINVIYPIPNASMIVCEDGYRASYDMIVRLREELDRELSRGKNYVQNQEVARSKQYRRDFPVPRKASAIDVPKCAIAWPSGVFREIPSFSVDVSDAKFPLEVTKKVERVMSRGNAADEQDFRAMVAEGERYTQEVERMEEVGRVRAAQGAPPQQPMPVFSPPTPAYVPPALPTMPSVSPPSAPGRTTTVCRTLSNGTIICS